MAEFADVAEAMRLMLPAEVVARVVVDGDVLLTCRRYVEHCKAAVSEGLCPHCLRGLDGDVCRSCEARWTAEGSCTSTRMLWQPALGWPR